MLNDTSLCVSLLNQSLSNRNIPKVTIQQYREKFLFPIKTFYESVGFNFENEPFEKTNKERKVDEGQVSEFIGIINYSIMSLIQIEKGVVDSPDLNLEQATKLYDHHLSITKSLMENKNHDYGGAWRDMRVSSLTDLIMQKILRIKQIEDNKGKTLVSEGIDANYQDMINYSVFALIHLQHK